MQVLTQNFKLTKVANLTAAGVTAINSTAVDMEGWESVFFFTTFQAIVSGGVQSINLAQGDTSGGSFADLLGTGITVVDNDDNQVFGIDLVKPTKQFVRLEVARATQNATVGEIYALQYNGSKLPITQSVTDAITVEAHVSPAEGTA